VGNLPSTLTLTGKEDTMQNSTLKKTFIVVVAAIVGSVVYYCFPGF
jgi:hypothetical protein